MEQESPHEGRKASFLKLESLQDCRMMHELSYVEKAKEAKRG